MEIDKILCGHALDILKTLPDESVNTVVTSPPYYAMRDYGLEPVVWDGDPLCQHDFVSEHIYKSSDGKGYKQDTSKGSWFESKSCFCSKCNAWRGSLGLEPSYQLYLQHLIQIFNEVKRVLRKDGTCFVNLGDKYGGSGNGSWNAPIEIRGKHGSKHYDKQGRYLEAGQEYLAPPLKDKSNAKSLLLIPERFAIAMTDSGWILRNVIIWNKKNPMPESVKDRFSRSWEYIYFFVKEKEKSNDIKEWIPKPLKPEEASWLAAMVDAEGCIGIRYSKTNRPHGSFGAFINVSNTNKQIINKCVSLTGLGHVKKATARANFDVWSWHVTHNNALAVIGEIYPYLIAKREQAKTAIALQKTNFRRGSIKGTNKGAPFLTDKQFQEKIGLWELCKKLNQKEVDNSDLPEPNLNRYGGCENYYFEQQFESLQAPKLNYKSTKKSNEQENAFFGNAPTNIGRCGNSEQGRNMRNVFHISTRSYKGSHFATFNTALISPLISAGCPEFVCKNCGKPRVKIYNEKRIDTRPGNNVLNAKSGNEGDPNLDMHKSDLSKYRQQIIHNEIGYTECGCDNPDYDAGIVLDPFGGVATTALAAKQLNRHYVCIELNADYVRQAEERIVKESVPKPKRKTKEQKQAEYDQWLKERQLELF